MQNGRGSEGRTHTTPGPKPGGLPSSPYPVNLVGVSGTAPLFSIYQTDFLTFRRYAHKLVAEVGFEPTKNIPLMLLSGSKPDEDNQTLPLH